MSATESRSVTVENEQGLHMRPAYLFAETAARFQSQIEVVKDNQRIDGKSVLSILTLGRRGVSSRMIFIISNPSATCPRPRE